MGQGVFPQSGFPNAGGGLPDPLVGNVSGDATIPPFIDIVVNTGDNDLTLPVKIGVMLQIKSVSGTATLLGGANSIENGSLVIFPQARSLLLTASGWIEIT